MRRRFLRRPEICFLLPVVLVGGLLFFLFSRRTGETYPPIIPGASSPEEVWPLAAGEKIILSLRRGEAGSPGGGPVLTREEPAVFLDQVLASLKAVHAEVRMTEESHRQMAERRLADLWREIAAVYSTSLQKALEEEAAVGRQEAEAAEEKAVEAYREQVRREFLPRLSALQLAMALTRDEKCREALAGEMTELMAAMEEKITSYYLGMKALETGEVPSWEERGEVSAVGRPGKEGGSLAWQEEDRRREAALLAWWSQGGGFLGSGGE